MCCCTGSRSSRSKCSRIPPTGCVGVSVPVYMYLDAYVRVRVNSDAVVDIRP